jgi:hypothetical protein
MGGVILYDRYYLYILYSRDDLVACIVDVQSVYEHLIHPSRLFVVANNLTPQRHI